jgi:hypothetical protein
LERPTPITEEMVRRDEQLRDSELTFYCRHIVSELKDFYPAEYDMLEMLSASNTIDFLELQRDPELVRHIREYGLVRLADGGRPTFAIPVVGRYLSSERARRARVALRRDIVPTEKRREWLDRRRGSILREIRSLQTLLERVGASQLFAGDSPPEVEKLWDVQVVTSEAEFAAFINIMNRCFVESIEKHGNKLGKKGYFWDEIKKALPEMWDGLLRIKVYRHYQSHLELTDRFDELYERYIEADLEGKSADETMDGWFALQQVTLDELLVGIQCGLNKYS